MNAWLNGPGKAFRKPLPGSTNYLSAYDKQGNLVRARKDDQQQESQRRLKQLDQEQQEAARADNADPNLSEEQRELRATERANRRNALNREEEEREGVPKERDRDMRPYPLNEYFKSQPVLSEALREQLYIQIVKYGHDLASVAASFGVDIRRVAAVVRLKTIEKRWVEEVSSNILSFLSFMLQ